MKLAINKLMTFPLGLALLSQSAIAQKPATAPTPSTTADISILPFSGPNMNDVVLDSQMTVSRSGNDTTLLDIHVSCYGTNLRGVANPISPISNVTAQIQYQTADGSYKYYNLKFPAAMVDKTTPFNQDLTTQSYSSTDSDGQLSKSTFRAHIKDNVIRVAMKNTRTIGLDLLSTKTDYAQLNNLDAKTDLIKSVRFLQEMPTANVPPQQYMGYDGPLTATINWYTSENGKQIKVYASFPGENKYCGGYFSPLVLKFKSPEKVPGLSKTSFFSLYTKPDAKLPGPQKITWPDFDEETYFLAVDSNNNGKIDNGGELFGDINGFENGFINLANFDDNKDGVIDEKDKIFANLLLWKDSNHDGVSQKGEIKKIQSKSVSSISLTYEKAIRDIGSLGKVLGPGEFTYKDKKGNISKGSVWDIFLVNAP